MFLRRIALAETKDGETIEDIQNTFHGGIWQVCVHNSYSGEKWIKRYKKQYSKNNEKLNFQFSFQVNQECFSMTQTKQSLTDSDFTFQQIKAQFDIDWQTVRWEELRKPFYSGLAARLRLQQLEPRKEIPWNVDEQASLWKDKVTTKQNADVQDFKDIVANFEKGIVMLSM